jgi:5S rRNA maturation endonuclease (ribonuclease M5)
MAIDVKPPTKKTAAKFHGCANFSEKSTPLSDENVSIGKGLTTIIDPYEAAELSCRKANREEKGHEFMEQSAENVLSEGWVKLPRAILKSGLMRKHNLYIFLSYCLSKTTHKPYTAIVGRQWVKLLLGQFVFGREKAAEETGLSVGEIRTCMKNLKAAGVLTIQPTNKFSIITVLNYGLFQGKGDQTTTYKNNILKKENISIRDIVYKFCIDHKEESGEIRFNCPYCGDTKKHLYANPVKEVFCCHKCGKKGTSHALYRELCPANAHLPLPNNRSASAKTTTTVSISDKSFSHPPVGYIEGCHKKIIGPDGSAARDYLHSRKITSEAIQEFRLGLARKYGRDWLVIPYFKDGKPVNVKYRTLPPADKSFRRWKNGESILFNQDCLKNIDSDKILLVEGELDVIALYSEGYRNVVGTTIGARSFKDEWLYLLRGIKRIIIVYDSDDSGQEGAKGAAKLLGSDRCCNVILPVKDPNDFLISGHSRADFEALLEKATCFTEVQG